VAIQFRLLGRCSKGGYVEPSPYVLSRHVRIEGQQATTRRQGVVAALHELPGWPFLSGLYKADVDATEADLGPECLLADAVEGSPPAQLVAQPVQRRPVRIDLFQWSRHRCSSRRRTCRMEEIVSAVVGLLLMLCSHRSAASIGQQYELRIDPHEALPAERPSDNPSNRPTGQYSIGLVKLFEGSPFIGRQALTRTSAASAHRLETGPGPWGMNRGRDRWQQGRLPSSGAQTVALVDSIEPSCPVLVPNPRHLSPEGHDDGDPQQQHGRNDDREHESCPPYCGGSGGHMQLDNRGVVEQNRRIQTSNKPMRPHLQTGH
jgi:hypothetical protein